MLLALLKDGEGLIGAPGQVLIPRKISLASLKWSIWYYLGKQIAFLPGESCSFKGGVFKGLLGRVQWHYGRWFQTSTCVWHTPGGSNSESLGSRGGECGLRRLETRVVTHQQLLGTPSSCRHHSNSGTGSLTTHSLSQALLHVTLCGPSRLSPSWSRDACFSIDECCSRCSFSVRLHWFKNV